MSEHSTIEWTDATWNPVRGCTKISPGCTHCYAETFAERFRGVPGHPYEQGFDLRLVPEKLAEPLRWSSGKMVFVNSMSDLFHESVPDEYIERVAHVMETANWHTFQVLTKRSERLRDLLQSRLNFAADLPHIWWGVSVEDRRYGLPRIDHLRSAPAIMRFLSVEPLLEDLGAINLDGIAWVIVGGESGSGARPMKEEWVLNIRDQCQSARVYFFFKQWGGVRKGQTGRSLDGRTYDEIPELTASFHAAAQETLPLIETVGVVSRPRTHVMNDQDLYIGREQTLIKHFILRKYLERFAHIIGSPWKTITYVDCFSGPWKSQSEELKDTSFSIALEELRKARRTHEGLGRSIQLRCMFLEKEKGPYSKLKEYADTVRDIAVETRNSEFATAVNAISDFVRKGGSSSFSFIFIDPTGWKGFDLKVIAPLLQLQSGEVLINFMTDYIRRFIDNPQEGTRDQFASLFGSEEVKNRVQALIDPRDREDALFRTYAENVQRSGGFTYTCAAIVLHPTSDRSFFHLIYATRHRKGVEVFKGVEQRAMEVQEQTRADAKQRKRVKRTGEPELFSGTEMPHTRPIDALRERYVSQAKEAVLGILQSGIRVPYERAWDLALSYPLVWDCDVKDWIAKWRAEAALKIEGMKPRRRVPRLDENNVLVWLRPS